MLRNLDTKDSIGAKNLPRGYLLKPILQIQLHAIIYEKIAPYYKWKEIFAMEMYKPQKCK